MAASAIVLAAGASTRMGEPKQLLQVGGRPLLELVVDSACGSRVDDVLVVLGAHAGLIRSRLRLGRARVLLNPDHAQGMSTSLRAGLSALGPEVDRAVIILGDQPDVSAGLLDILLGAQESAGLPAAALSFAGLLHPPVVLARQLWGEMMALEGDVGCRRLIRTRPDLVAAVPAATPRDHPLDIDTPDDFRRFTGAG